MKRWFSFGLFILLILNLSFVSAAYIFNVEIAPIKDDIYVNESAVFNLTVINDQHVMDTFRFRSDDIWWSIYTEPQSDYFGGLKVFGQQEKSTKLLLTPKKGLLGGKYAVEIVLESQNTGVAIKKLLNINVHSLKPPIPDYQPTIKLDIELANNGKFDPRNPAIIKVILKNKNALNLTEISVTLKSKLIDEERYPLTLDPLERRTEEFSINFDPNEQPQKDTLLITASVGNKTFVAIHEFEIIPYVLSFEQEVILRRKFLKKINEIKVTNPSNTQKQEVVLYRAPALKALFSGSEPQGGVQKINRKRFLAWNIELEAQESTSILVTYNQRPIFIIFLLIVGGIVLYFLVRSPVSVTKKLTNIRKREGGISGLRIQINVKNRSSEPVYDIKVIDKIPSIAEVLKEFQLGSLQPSKIVEREKKSTIIRWDIDTLESNEERLISYDIKSKLSILGELNLYATVVKFKDKKGKERKALSNILRVAL